ncbi:MAG TPA: sodium:proton antiporter [Gammaproteobacteria bacterium]|nr:sodium:proton antiporter [Gammaproteobacteria bacterium]
MTDLASVLNAQHLLLLMAVLLATGVVCSWVARKLHLPDLVLYLLAGMLLGPHGAGFFTVPVDSTLEQLMLAFGASYILFEGGTGVRFEVFRQIWLTVTLIATLGVLISAAVVCVAAHYALSLPWLAALLLGAVVAATDPAALIPLFRQISVRERLAQMVICEAAFNDAVSAVLAFALVGAAGAGGLDLGVAAESFALQAGVGLLAGVALGFAAAFLMGHGRYGFLRDYAPLVTLITVIGAYLGADRLGASGFMAVFVAGMILGNRHSFGFTLAPGENRRLHEYADTTAMILRMIVFMLLGAQIDLQAMGGEFWGAAACVLALMLVARPLTVLSCALPDRRVRWSGRELLFMCWTRETGVIPGALAGMLLARGVGHAEQIAGVTFLAIVVTLLLQGGTSRWVATRLGVLEPGTRGG